MKDRTASARPTSATILVLVELRGSRAPINPGSMVAPKSGKPYTGATHANWGKTVTLAITLITPKNALNNAKNRPTADELDDCG